MAGDFAEMSLIDLFREEVVTHLANLTAALAAAAMTASPADLEALSRAAHSIKGAARIVDLGVIADLAGAMEDRVDAARAGTLLGAAAISALRDGTEILRELTDIAKPELTTWLAAQRTRCEHVAAALAASRTREPAPPPPARPAAPPPNLEPSLRDLFRLETESNAATLNQGLLALENDPSHLELIDQLMRAAHSIKGAARIVNVELAVGLAHVMEDCLVAAQSGELVLTPDHVDLLLRGTDQLNGIARAGDELPAWVASHEREVHEVAARIEAIRREAPPLAPAEATPRPAPAATAEPPTPPATNAAAAGDRVVRVTVQNINRLMNLAGESLVEARRLDGFTSALHKLAAREGALADQLDHVAHLLQDGVPAEHILAVLAESRARALEVRRDLEARVAELETYAVRAEDLTTRLYRQAIASRMRPFGDGLHGFPRLVRDVARKLGKKVELSIVGDSVGVDREILEKLEAPLNHMLRNAVDHGIEPPEQRRIAGKPERATVRLEARHWAGMLSVTVSDDGRGIDPARVRERIVRRGLVDADTADALTDAELLDFIFAPGFSTADQVTEISGRGVGLDVVRAVVQEVGGSLRVSSEIAKGTAFHLQLPITLSVIRAVVVEIAGEPYAFPLTRIERILMVPPSELRTLENRQYFVYEGKNVGIVPAQQILDLDEAPRATGDLPVIVLHDRASLCGVAVDRFLGEHDLVVRPLDPRLGKVADISAAAVMTDGSPVLIVDVEDMVRSIMRLLRGGRLRRVVGAAAAVTTTVKHVLVVDDSITVREVQRQILTGRGYEVTVCVDGMDGWQALREHDFDLVITDVDMPRMNGIELVRSIKQDPRLKRVPAMIVSYRDSADDRRRGLDAGANYYLFKSDFHDDALVSAVVDLIGEASR